jgi:hypothetical protein
VLGELAQVERAVAGCEPEQLGGAGRRELALACDQLEEVDPGRVRQRPHHPRIGQPA